MTSLAKNVDFLHQISKDLEWVITSPSMVKANHRFLTDVFFTSQYENLKDKINALASQSSLINALFTNSQFQVGDYFERLIMLWLQLNSNYSDIQQHIRIYENKRTVGELDFLFNDKLNKFSCHWEVAVKFFMLHQPTEGDIQFLGPNATDSFNKKYQKLVQKQLPLSASVLAKAQMDYTKFSAPICAKGLLKGFLFYPTDYPHNLPQKLFENISANHLSGWWTAINHLNIPKQSENSYWMVMKKPYWFSVNQAALEMLYNHKEIRQFALKHFTQHQYPLLLAELVQSNGKWREISRGFVVNEDWPNRNSPT